MVGTEPGSIHVAKLMLQTHFRNEVSSTLRLFCFICKFQNRIGIILMNREVGGVEIC